MQLGSCSIACAGDSRFFFLPQVREVQVRVHDESRRLRQQEGEERLGHLGMIAVQQPKLNHDEKRENDKISSAVSGH